MSSKRRPAWKSPRTLAIVAAVAAAAVIAVIAVVSQQGGDDQAAPSQSAQTAPSQEPTTSPSEDNPNAWLLDLPRREQGDPLALGEVDAPVVIIEYADFTCGYCAAFSQESMPQIISQYVDSGQVRLEWQHAPVISENSMPAAIATQAAAEQGFFWEYGDLIYEQVYNDQEPWSREELIALASQIEGLDVAAFEAALDDPQVRAIVEEQAAESSRLGVNSTPMFVVGTQVLQGAQPLDTFQAVVEAELALAS